MLLGMLQLQFTKCEFVSHLFDFLLVYSELIFSSETMGTKTKLTPFLVWQQYLSIHNPKWYCSWCALHFFAVLLYIPFIVPSTTDFILVAVMLGFTYVVFMYIMLDIFLAKFARVNYLMRMLVSY